MTDHLMRLINECYSEAPVLLVFTWYFQCFLYEQKHYSNMKMRQNLLSSCSTC